MLPNLVLVCGVLFMLVAGARKTRSRQAHYVIGLIGLIVIGIATLATVRLPEFSRIGTLFVFDGFTRFFLLFALLSTAVSLILSSQSLEISKNRFAEFSALLLTLCTGIALMASATDLLMAYLAMETVSLSSYVLTGFRRSHPLSHEAALKYVIYGGVASGIMIFGMSMLYGFAGTTQFSELAAILKVDGFIVQTGSIGSLGIIVAMMFVFTGFCFKIAAVPFHMWCPDVYQGAPTPFTGFLSVAPKAAGFALLLRFLSELFYSSDVSIKTPILAIIGLISAVTMTLGNLTALHQMNVKRLLAYSSIAHAGYILMGVVVLDLYGSSAVLIYLAVYLFMNLGAFAVVQSVADSEGSEDITAFRGLGYRSPFLAVSMGIFLFSLAGLPPLAGFIGKFYLFAALIRTNAFWLVVLAVIGIVNSLIALFYYVRIIREMFLTQPDNKAALVVARANLSLIGLLVVPTVVFGIYWEPLRRIVKAAAAALNLS